MPISESIDRYGCHRLISARSVQGFTLIEIMLVLVIIGITVSLAAISLSVNPASTVDREGQRLLAVINEASDEAVAKGVELALALSRDSTHAAWQYRLLILDKEDLAWTLPEDEIADTGIWRAYTLPEALRVDLTLEGQGLNAQQLEQMSRVQGMGGPEGLRPSILFLSSGELSPFSIRLSHRDTPHHVVLESDGLSGVELL